MPSNKGISAIQAIHMPDGGNPFFLIQETNQPPCSVGVEDTDVLSVGREYRFAFCRGISSIQIILRKLLTF